MTAANKKGLAVASGQALKQSTRNDLNSATAERPDKAFHTLQAKFAIAGHCLQRTVPEDGPVAYFVTRWGLVRHLEGLDDAHRFLKQIGG